MAPPGGSQTLLSPAELSYLHTSLSLQPPIRPDLRTPTQFRPLVAETDFIPSTNGSARVCFSDGTEAIVGVKAELEKTFHRSAAGAATSQLGESEAGYHHGSPTNGEEDANGLSSGWLEVSLDIPGYRSDDPLSVFLSSKIAETLLASETLLAQLMINSRWHWKLYIDILMLSPPLSYPLPLISLAVHLALLNTALPRRTSELEDDPIFDDDWQAAEMIYSRKRSYNDRPPVTLLVVTVGSNVVFDPSKDELAVAENVLAVSFVRSTSLMAPKESSSIKLLSIRMIDPPSRLTPPGLPDAINPATMAGGATNTDRVQENWTAETLTEGEKASVWQPPRGGMRRALLATILTHINAKGGVGDEIMDGLAAVAT